MPAGALPKLRLRAYCGFGIVEAALVVHYNRIHYSDFYRPASRLLIPCNIAASAVSGSFAFIISSLRRRIRASDPSSLFRSPSLHTLQLAAPYLLHTKR